MTNDDPLNSTAEPYKPPSEIGRRQKKQSITRIIFAVAIGFVFVVVAASATTHFVFFGGERARPPRNPDEAIRVIDAEVE